MCGIFGGYKSLLHAPSSGILSHRGPDQDGGSVHKLNNGAQFLMWTTRLKIVDSKDIDFPISRLGHVISFNGEIYNWLEIRRNLECLGHKFFTHTDIEVALLAYLEWGPACLEMFNGMFAFAVFDGNELFLARDRFGKKPLFLFNNGTEFAFASELKAFKNLQLNESPSLKGSFPWDEDQSLFKNITSVKPGEYRLIDVNHIDERSTRWYSFPQYSGDIDNTDLAIDTFLEIFSDACAIRKIADAPVTLFLSGGVDSVLIQSMVHAETTYTCQFEEFLNTINEVELVKGLAKKINFDARIISPTKSDLEQCISNLGWHSEFALGTSIFPSFCLSREARKDGFKVAFSGEGADELFNGCVRNEVLLEERDRIDGYEDGPYREMTSKYFSNDIDRAVKLAMWHTPDMYDEVREKFESVWDNRAPLAHNLSVVETTFFLPEKLMSADRMSMANSLEVRNPFLDYRVVDFSCRLMPAIRRNSKQGKSIIRAALQKVLGDAANAVLQRTVKHGMPAPINRWFFDNDGFSRENWKSWIEEEISSSFCSHADDSSLLESVL